MGWIFLKEEKEGNVAIAVKKRNSNFLRHSRRSTRWILVVLGSILLLSLYLPHTWGGEANLEEYYKTLKDLDKRTCEEINQKYQNYGIIPEGEAAARGPFVGDGTRLSRGSTARYYEMESKFESLLMEWITKHEIKLAHTFCKHWELASARMNKLDFGKQSEQQLQKWKIIDYIAVPIKSEKRSIVARNFRAQNLTDHWPVMTCARPPQKKEGWRYGLERMEAKNRK